MSETVAMTLTEFLLARIAEDQEAARDAQQEGAYLHYADTAAEECVEMAQREGCAPEGYRYLRRWLPARVLAECEAKRRIVELHPAEWNDAWRVNHCPTCSDSSHTTWSEPTWPCATLRALAAIYADHPDYREEWKP